VAAEEGTEHAQHRARGDDDDDVAKEGTEHARWRAWRRGYLPNLERYRFRRMCGDFAT
jgi:hypothetical protein